MIPDLLKLMTEEHDRLIQVIMKERDYNVRYDITCYAANLESLIFMLTAWSEDRLCKERMMTQPRLDMEIRQAEEGEADQTKTAEQRAYWERKLHDLKLLNNMVASWRDETLGSVRYAIDIQK